MVDQPQGHWLCDGPDSDVILSCRVRLARNIAGFPFVNRASNTQRHELVNVARQAMLGASLADNLLWVDLRQATPRDRQLLVERHLISKPHAAADTPRAVAIWDRETVSVMVNEEDHLRMQALAAGLQLDETFRRISAVDDAIESRLDYAFSSRWGYLTACPTNVGTGVRFSAMMHLPALQLTKEIDRVRRAAKDLHLAVRGYYGEGSESAGDFYQVSNQTTLGRTEAELLHELQDQVLPRIVEYEREARRMLALKQATMLDDRVHRALGVLRGARLLGVEEAMKLLSRVRLGVALERVRDISQATINRLFLQIQNAHLQPAGAAEISADSLKEARAALIRSALG